MGASKEPLTKVCGSFMCPVGPFLGCVFIIFFTLQSATVHCACEGGIYLDTDTPQEKPLRREDFRNGFNSKLLAKIRVSMPPAQCPGHPLFFFGEGEPLSCCRLLIPGIGKPFLAVLSEPLG